MAVPNILSSKNVIDAIHQVVKRDAICARSLFRVQGKKFGTVGVRCEIDRDFVDKLKIMLREGGNQGDC